MRQHAGASEYTRTSRCIAQSSELSVQLSRFVRPEGTEKLALIARERAELITAPALSCQEHDRERRTCSEQHLDLRTMENEC